MSIYCEERSGPDTPQEEVEEPKISSISITLDSQPSCLEFSRYNSEYFVVGTYVLEEPKKLEPDRSETSRQDEISLPKQNRSGSLMLFRLQGQNLYGRQCCMT